MIGAILGWLDFSLFLPSFSCSSHLQPFHFAGFIASILVILKARSLRFAHLQARILGPAANRVGKTAGGEAGHARNTRGNLPMLHSSQEHCKENREKPVAENTECG